jgi:hypothetical protein
MNRRITARAEGESNVPGRKEIGGAGGERVSVAVVDVCEKKKRPGWRCRAERGRGNKA